MTSLSGMSTIRIAIILLSAGSFVYLSIIGALVVFQRSMIYFPSHQDVPPRGEPPFVPWTKDQEFLGYVRMNRTPPKRAAVLFHGNGGEAIDRSWFSELISNDDMVLVLGEYPGYGAKVGEPSEASITSSAKDLVREIRSRWQVPITVVGESLGTGVACAVAKEPGVDRLALISPFLSVLDVAKSQYPFLPVSLLLKDSYRSDLFLKGVELPLHVIHGTDDDIVPFASGKQLFDQYAGSSKWHTELPKTAHNDIVPKLLTAPEAAAFRTFLQNP